MKKAYAFRNNQIGRQLRESVNRFWHGSWYLCCIEAVSVVCILFGIAEKIGGR
jgi:hypothetical protein